VIITRGLSHFLIKFLLLLLNIYIFYYFFKTDPAASHTFFLNDRRGGKWRSPQAAVIPDLHLPMRSFEVKNRQDNNNNNNKLLSIF